eukprot:COSAG06_NODE_480_length_15163_cov_50.478757_17_plen_361_part_00
MVTVAELKAQAKQQGLKRYSKLKKAELIKLLNNNTNTPVKKTKVKKTNVRKLKYDEETLRDMYPKLIGAFLTEQNKKYTKDELTIAYGKVDKVIQSKVEARKWKEAFDEKYPNKEIKQQKINKMFSKPKSKQKLKEPKPVKKKVVPKKKNNKDINYKKVFKVFDKYYKLVNVEFKKYLKGQISSNELDEKQYNELEDEYDYKGLAISLGLYKDIRSNRFIDPNIQKQLNKDSKNYQEFKELIKKPAPIDPIEDDEDIDNWEGEDLTCYLDTYLGYGKPDDEPWSEVKKGLAKEHRSFQKYRSHLLQGYKFLTTKDKDMIEKNCGDKKYMEALDQSRAIMNAKNYKEYYQLYKLVLKLLLI